MKIETKSTINISKENEPLVSVLAQFNGYFPEMDLSAFLQDVISKTVREALSGLIIQPTNKYFGIAQKEKADFLTEQLKNGGLTVETTIINE